MKYSNLAGVLAATVLICLCFVPWVYISSIDTSITGFRTEHTNFGRPGAVHVFLSAIAIFFFLLPKVWAKRSNLFVTTLNFAWAIRNFLLITQCELGDCPEKRPGIYAIVFVSLIMLVMSMLPKLDLNTQE